MFERAILHLDLDAFFVSVECLRNDRLRGRPVIIGGGSERGVVVSCNYEARAYGLHSAMPIKVALRLCPDALVLRGDMETYSKYSRLISEIIESEAPLFEKSSIDEFYVDLTGMDRYFGCWRWSQEFRQKIIQESGLPISIGLSINKLVSKVGAGEAKPNGMQLVENGGEKAFLGPLSVWKLPCVGRATYKKLRIMGVRDVRTLSRIPVKLLQREFGKPGVELWKKANAQDDSPVVPYREQKSMSAERTFQVDTTDIQKLRDQLAGMVLQLAFELRQAQQLTSCVTVKIRYADFNTCTKQSRIPYTASDRTLTRCARHLLEGLFERRQLVRLVGVRFSGLVRGHPQMNLFEEGRREERLMGVMDEVRRKFGNGALNFANGGLKDGVILEA